ncbi:MAG: hypothetical protein JXA73_23825 [Acidobacteria bacterium]|nr:hypothetical protein [Acidobacteriota bacterium]
MKLLLQCIRLGAGPRIVVSTRVCAASLHTFLKNFGLSMPGLNKSGDKVEGVLL